MHSFQVAFEVYGAKDFKSHSVSDLNCRSSVF